MLTQEEKQITAEIFRTVFDERMDYAFLRDLVRISYKLDLPNSDEMSNDLKSDDITDEYYERND